MPRTRSISDEDLLDSALQIIHHSGPSSLSFGSLAERVDLAGSTLVQRFGSRAGLLQAALLLAWDRLDADTHAADAAATPDASGAIDFLVALSGQYEAHEYADQLMVLREDLRDPVLRARGEAWIATVIEAIERRFMNDQRAPDGLGEMVVAQWQGTLVVWGFTRSGDVSTVVRRAITSLVALIGERIEPSPPRR